MKYLLLLTFLFSLDVALSQCLCTSPDPINNGLIACYPFDGNANDLSGNNNHGVASAVTPAPDRFGNPNSAYYFNGNTSIIEVPPSSTLRPQNRITISVWVKPEPKPLIPPTWNFILTCRRDNYSAPYNSYNLGTITSAPYSNKWTMFLSSTSNALDNELIGKNPKQENTWQHVVATYDGVNMNIYTNGKLDTSRAINIPSFLYSNYGVNIGNHNAGPSTGFLGTMDDLKIYNRALTPCEVSYLYNNCQPMPKVNLISDTIVKTCAGKLETISSDYPSYSHQWSPASIFNNPDSIQPTFQVTQSQYIYLTAIDGGCLFTDSVWVEVNEPNISLPRNSTICLGDSVQLVATGAQVYAWEWNTTLSDTTINNPYAKPSMTTWYKVKAQVNGCTIKDSSLVSVTNQLTVEAGIDTLVCKGDTLGLSASGGTKFSWTPLQDILASNTINPRVFPKTPRWYYVVGSSGVCTATDSVFVDVKPLPQLQIDDTLFCGVSSFTPTIAIQSGISRVLWEPQTFLSTNSVLNPIISATSSIGYNVTAQTDYGCSASDSFNVKISNVIANFSVVNHPLEVPENLSVVNTSSGNGLRYTWLLNNQPWSNAVNPQQLISSAGMYTVKLIAEDLDGCIDSLVKNIEAKNEQKIFIPNVFSPNGDNINDKFTISIDMSLVKKLEGTVWNRWGQKVADFNGVQDNWWDGKSRGAPCPDGVYFFMVIITDTKEMISSYNGTITIVR